MRRVLLTVHKFLPEHKAGTEVLTLKVAQELKRRGYEVLIVTANPPDLDARHASGSQTSDYVYDGLPVHVVEESLRLEGYTFKHEHFHPGIKNHFADLLKKFGPDLVHIFHAQNLSSSIIDASQEQNIPVVCSTTDFWFVCPVVQLKRPNGAVCRGPSPGAINCLTCYTPKLFPPDSEFAEAFGAKYLKANSLIQKLPFTFLRRLCMKGLYAIYGATKLPSAIEATIERPAFLRDAANRTKAIMVPTRLMQDIFLENGIDAALIHHVPYGLDTKPLIPYQQKLSSKTLRVGFIGTIFEHKGVDLLIKAFQALPDQADALLKIYGDMEQFPEYASKLKALCALPLINSSKIIFCGTFPNAQLGEVLQDIDVLVVPSRWYENTPLVIQSALATKTPLIATDLGGMSELIRPGFNGFLFQLNDPFSLRDQIMKLLEDRALLEQLRHNIPEERTTEQMVDDIEKVYLSVLGSHNAPTQIITA